MKLGWMLVVSASCGFPRPADVLPPDGDPGTTECQITAIEPALANTGAILAVEGTFGDTVTVTFPGGATAAATASGEHRATVVVPALATAGELTVAACGSTLGPRPFRRASFALGLGNFEASFDQTNTARRTTRLVTAREGATAAVTGKSLYILGGASGDGPVDSIEQVSINADGSLGVFSNNPGLRLATPRTGHTSVTIDKYLYTIGGRGDGPLRSIERATRAGDGSLGPSTIVPDVALTTARFGHTISVIGNRLYVLGGRDGDPLDSIEYATINEDGSLGPFKVVPSVRLSTARHGHVAVVAGNYLYVAGGAGAISALEDIERSTIGSDGSLGSFEVVAGLKLGTARWGHAAVVLGNALYVVGGIGNSGPLDSVEAAALDLNGLTGSFAIQSETMLTARHTFATAIVDNYVYFLGGAGTSKLASVERATLNVGGGLEPSSFSGLSLAVSRAESTAVVVQNYVYIVGGEVTAANVVERAAIGIDGRLGSFATIPGVALNTPRRRHTAAVIGNYLYVIGGTGASGRLRSLERASISADGSLGAFASAGDLTSPRSAHTNVVVGDFLYVIGGDDSTGLLATVERAAINPDGSLSSFSIVSGLVLQTARQGHRSALIRDHVYIVGGDTSNVERARIGADGSLGSFAAVSNVMLRNDQRFEATVSIVGNQLYVLGGDHVTGQGQTESARISPTGSLLNFEFSSSSIIRRFGHSTLVIGNQLYILGGATMTGAPAETAVDVALLN